ncbi:MAG: helix-turn-helix domain-containing protein [Lachnospiraceae bacterium]|nr:helix-turn-helix domain-containing protein [Lachnospiraceae bacterium]
MEDKISKKSIGKRIMELRKKNNEKQKDLAELLATVPNNISKIESGATGLTCDNLIKIAEHYNVSTDYLCKGEGGVDLLDTLKKYINFRYASIDGIADDDHVHLIPIFTINKHLYDYFFQIAHANCTSQMPENIKQQWIEQATEEFNRNIINDTYSDYCSFIPLSDTVLEEHRDIIQIIEKHSVE